MSRAEIHKIQQNTNKSRSLNGSKRITKRDSQLVHSLTENNTEESSNSEKLNENFEDSEDFEDSKEDFEDIKRFIAKLAINRLLISDAAAKLLSDSDDLSSEIGRTRLEDKRYVNELISKQNKLSQEALEKYEESKKLEDENFRLKQERVEFEIEKEKLLQEMERVTSQNKEKSSHLNKKLKSDMEENLLLLDVIRSTFQKLIHLTGIDWTSDEETMELMFDLGKKPEL